MKKVSSRKRRKMPTRTGSSPLPRREPIPPSPHPKKREDRMTRTWTGCLLVLLLLVCAPAGFAQKDSATRSVQGSVSNPDDSAVVGAVVQIKNMKTLQIRSFITLEDGTYRFFELCLLYTSDAADE